MAVSNGVADNDDACLAQCQCAQGCVGGVDGKHPVSAQAQARWNGNAGLCRIHAVGDVFNTQRMAYVWVSRTTEQIQAGAAGERQWIHARNIVLQCIVQPIRGFTSDGLVNRIRQRFLRLDLHRNQAGQVAGRSEIPGDIGNRDGSFNDDRIQLY